MWQLFTLQPQSEAQRHKCWARLSFSFSFSPRLQPTGMEPTTFREGLPYSDLSRNTLPTLPEVGCHSDSKSSPADIEE